jgi:uncharacterized protein (DUF302 family)
MNELSVTVHEPLEKAEVLVREALAERGFGVLTEIDVAKVFAEKLGVTRTPLKILGACNPMMANAALIRDPSAALALPCNVSLLAVTSSETEVNIADPTVMMPGDNLAELAHEAKQRLLGVVRALSA